MSRLSPKFAELRQLSADPTALRTATPWFTPLVLLLGKGQNQAMHLLSYNSYVLKPKSYVGLLYRGPESKTEIQDHEYTCLLLFLVASYRSSAKSKATGQLRHSGLQINASD